MRVRIALDDKAELVVIGPAIKKIYEDTAIDAIIRKYRYINTQEIMRFTAADENIKSNLSAVVQLINGFSEGRFSSDN